VKFKRILTIGLASALVVGACSAASPSPSTSTAPSAPAASASTAASEAPSASVAATPLPVDPAEAVIKNVEANATIKFWTFYLSPTFDGYIKDTIARFEATYPGVKVDWEDHQATFQDDLNNAFAAGNAPDVINLSVSEGWVSDYASRGVLLNLDHHITTEPFGDVNYVDPEAASVGILAYKIIRQLGTPLSKDAAECIYASILADTGVRLVPIRKANMRPNLWADKLALREHRSRVETTNSQLAAMGVQQLHARTNPGFELKVHASLLALTIINAH